MNHGKNSAENTEQKQRVEHTLSDMEDWFAKQLFSAAEENTPYAREVQQWLQERNAAVSKARAMLSSRRKVFQAVKIFSVLSAVFMGLGSTYLIVEALSVIPYFATIPFASWPLIVLPMATIAAAAYVC